MNQVPWLSLLTFLPALGGLLVIGLGKRERLARGLALGCSLLPLALAAVVWTRFIPEAPGFQLVELHPWVRALGIDYHLGVDGLGLLMVMLSALVVPMSLLASWRIREGVALYFGLVLLLEAGLMGTFTALNFFHWFLFWELSLVPAFFLIKFWGGPLRTPAAAQFFVYTMVGSIAMLLAFLAIVLATHTSDFPRLAELGQSGSLDGSLSEQLGWRNLTSKRLALVVFFGAFLGFAVKVPMVPFHTWLPPAYAEAPTGTAMLMTGVMSKMGVYGFLRILLPLFPQEMSWVLTPLLWLAVATIILPACAAFAQRDLKRMLAYSSINHLGYCLLGIFTVLRPGAGAAAPLAEKAAALNGVLLQMFNHGLTAATLFWFVGLIEERGGGLRGVNDFGGLRKVAPVFCGLMGVALFSSLGLPGLNGFVGEFLIFKGSFPLAGWASALSLIGLLVTAVMILTLLQKVFNGPLNQRWSGFPDLTFGERMAVLPPLGLMLFLGVYPQAVIGVVNGTVVQWVQHLRF